jgi:HAD superfamily hydrolase (TIGR01490 family)
VSYFVFSDVDETLINCRSILKFMADFLFSSSHEGIIDVAEKRKAFNTIIKWSNDPSVKREDLNRRYYYLFKGITQSALQNAALHWVNEHINREDFFIHQVLIDYQEHQKHGAEIILISGSFREILLPIMAHVNATHLICSELEIKDGVYTGKLLQQTIGEGKWNAIVKYIGEKKVQLSSCYAYGDHISDICFMEKVGYPVLVGGSDDIKQHATKNNWRLIAL